MSVIENSKVTVVGAGSVGSSVAYAALIRGSARHVALYDINTAKVEVLDLAHGTLFTGTSDITGGSDISVAAGSHVVVITAGAKQNPGQSRIELAGVNAGILRKMLPQLLEVAPDAVYVIVTNPCDVLTVLAQEDTGLPPERLFASGTVLDTSRLRWKLAHRAGVATSSVHAYIIGEHGDTEFALWSHASIGTVPLLEWESDGHPRMTVDELDAITVDVRDSAYKVIQGKGATNYAIGIAGARIVGARRRLRRERGGALGALDCQFPGRVPDPPDAVLAERARAAAPVGRRPARGSLFAALIRISSRRRPSPRQHLRCRGSARSPRPRC